MKRFLAALALLLLIASPALAAWNIQQTPDGGVRWIDGEGNTSPAASGVITVRIPNISSASTTFVAAQKVGKIVRYYATLTSNWSGGGSPDSPIVTLGLVHPVSGGSPFTWVARATSPSSTASGNVIVMATGALSWTSGIGYVAAATPLADNTVDYVGQMISVHTDGGSADSNGGESWVTIVIE